MDDITLRDCLKQDFRRSAVVGGFLLLCLLLVVAFRGVMVPFLVAIFIAYLVEPLVGRLARVKIGPVALGRAGSVIILYLFLAGVLTLTCIGLLPRVSQQVSSLAQSAPAAFQTVRNDWVPKVDAWIDEMMGPSEEDETKEGDGEEGDVGTGESTPPAEVPLPGSPAIHEDPTPDEDLAVPAEALDEWTLEFPWDGKVIRGRVYRGPTRDDGPAPEPPTLASAMDSMVEEIQTHFVSAVGVVTTVLGGIVGFVYSFVLILMITAFIVIDRERIAAYFDSLPPDRYREQYRRGIRIIDAGLSGVVRGQILVCLINGLLTWIGLVILGVPYSLLLGAIAMVFSLIPIFGTILSSIPIVAISLSQGFGYALSALAWITVIHLIEANVINPRVIGTTARLHPVIIVFALLAGEHAFGVVGALLAVPAASILISTFRYARAEAAEPEG
jgi:predicted PurR-regulated permease PerM